MNFSTAKSKKFVVFVAVLLIVTLVSACSGKSAPKETLQPAPSSSDTSQEQTKEVEKKEPTTVAEVAMYNESDRYERLVAAAKKEGQVTLYGSMAVDDMKPIIEEFEKKYGIKVNHWRAGSENVLQRIVTEYQGKRYDVDVVETNGPEMEALYREQLFQEVNTPYLNDLIPEAVMPHKQWIATRLNIFTLAWNTNQVKKEDLPNNYEGFLDPKWKGLLGVEAEDVDWFAETVKHLGEEKGLQLFKDIVAANGFSVRKGHTLLSNLVASGEVPLALTVYNYKPEQLKKEGAPIDWYAIEPAIARPNGIAVLKNAANPNAAVLFYDFMLTDAQQILLENDFVPTNKKIDAALAKMKIRFVDPAVVLDEKEKWDKLWEEIVIKPNNK